MALIHYDLQFIHLISKNLIYAYPERIRLNEAPVKDSVLIIQGIECKVYTHPTIDIDKKIITQFVIYVV